MGWFELILPIFQLSDSHFYKFLTLPHTNLIDRTGSKRSREEMLLNA